MAKRISSFYFQPAVTHEKAAYPGKEVNLIVSVSKHVHQLKSGKLKYQDKIIDLPLDKLSLAQSSPDKDVIIHFLLKDSFSSLIHAESYSYSNIISMESFLYRAFRKKKSNPFYGFPETLIIPASVMKVYPALEVFCFKAGIKITQPESGFRSGIDSVRYWESMFYDHTERGYPYYVPALFLKNKIANLSASGGGYLTRYDAWENGLKLRPVPLKEPHESFEQFIENYWPSISKRSGFENEFVYDFDSDNN
jgi:hypothetical protein